MPYLPDMLRTALYMVYSMAITGWTQPDGSNTHWYHSQGYRSPV